MATPSNFSAANITSPSMAYVSVAVGASLVGGFKALFVGSAGDLLIYSFDCSVNSSGVITGTPVTTLFVGVQAGTILPVMGLAVGTTASGTNAGSLVALK